MCTSTSANCTHMCRVLSIWIWRARVGLVWRDIAVTLTCVGQGLWAASIIYFCMCILSTQTYLTLWSQVWSLGKCERYIVVDRNADTEKVYGSPADHRHYLGSSFSRTSGLSLLLKCGVPIMTIYYQKFACFLVRCVRLINTINVVRTNFVLI